MERYELMIKKVIEGKKRLIYNFLVIEFILITLSIYFFSNPVDSRYFSIGCSLVIIAALLFIGFKILNNDLNYCVEYYKVDKIQVIRKLKMNNPLVKITLLLVDFNHIKIYIKKAHEAILYVNKYKERVEIGPWMIETDFDKNKNLRKEEECQQNLDDKYCVNFYKQTTKLDHQIKTIFNQLGVYLNYPINITYNESVQTVTYEITYKVYGFLVNYTSLYMEEGELKKLELDNQVVITLDDSNLDSIKYEVDPYFEIKIKLNLPLIE